MAQENKNTAKNPKKVFAVIEKDKYEITRSIRFLGKKYTKEEVAKAPEVLEMLLKNKWSGLVKV